MALVTRKELEEEGWIYAGATMLICESRPDLWEAWVSYATANVDWHQTTSTKLGGRLLNFIEDKLKGEGKDFDQELANYHAKKRA